MKFWLLPNIEGQLVWEEREFGVGDSACYVCVKQILWGDRSGRHPHPACTCVHTYFWSVTTKWLKKLEIKTQLPKSFALQCSSITAPPIHTLPPENDGSPFIHPEVLCSLFLLILVPAAQNQVDELCGRSNQPPLSQLHSHCLVTATKCLLRMNSLESLFSLPVCYHQLCWFKPA